MLLFWVGFALAGQGYVFSNATVYDAAKQELREGWYLLVSADGTLEAVGLEAFPAPTGADIVEGALIAPHLTDFYSLLQERGLGFDEDFDTEHQLRMATTFRKLGIGAIRDPVFPPQAVTAGLEGIEVFAQRGYVALQGSAGARFGTVLDPQEPLEYALERMPLHGPVTLWWTSRGTSDRIRWSDHPQWLGNLLQALKGRGQKVGAFVEGATGKELESLIGLPLDFLEGLPDDLSRLSVSHFPKLVWVPLMALNDKRYCAKDLEDRMIQLKPLELFDFPTLERARGMVRQAQAGMLDRCKIWQQRRPECLATLREWIEEGGEVAIGSAGGHPFSFSGELEPELELLQNLGMDRKQLCRALFETTPALLGIEREYLRIGRPAHFVVYTKVPAKALPFGKQVSMNFMSGSVVEPTVEGQR